MCMCVWPVLIHNGRCPRGQYMRVRGQGSKVSIEDDVCGGYTAGGGRVMKGRCGGVRRACTARLRDYYTRG